MAVCDVLQIGGAVSLKYKTCKQDLNFEQGSDEAFVDFLLDTSVKVIDIMKHLTPVLQVVNLPSPVPVDPPGIPSSSKLPKVSTFSTDCLSCRPSVHRPLFQPPPLHNVPRHWPETPPSRSHHRPSNNFVQKLPNFVKPSVSRDHNITEKSFINFKCMKVSPPAPSIPTASEGDDTTTTTSPKNDQSPKSVTDPAIPPPIIHDNNGDVLEPPDSTDTAKTIEHFNQEISQFQKEIGNVLESLTQSTSDRDTVDNKLRDYNRVSMVGMRYSDQPGPSSKRSKVSYTRLNSRYKKYPDEMLKQAMQSVQMGYKTVAQAAKEYSIPRQTLQYRLFKRKKKFHVFAPNIPYTNNFFIENYNNTNTSNNTGCPNSAPTNIKSEPQSCSPESDDHEEPLLENMPEGSALMVDADIRLSLERTVQDMLDSDLIRKPEAPVEPDSRGAPERTENQGVDDSGEEQTGPEQGSGSEDGCLDSDTVKIKKEIITLIEMTGDMQT